MHTTCTTEQEGFTEIRQGMVVTLKERAKRPADLKHDGNKQDDEPQPEPDISNRVPL